MLDKMHGVHARSQAIGEFCEWLDEQGITLAVRHQHEPADRGDLPDEITTEGQEQGCYRTVEHLYRSGFDWERRFYWDCGYTTDELVPLMRSIEQLLADHFAIDLVVAERERRALLAEVRRND